MDNIKALHLFNSYLPQTENWAYNLIGALNDCEIHIAAKNYLKENFYRSDFHFVDNYFDEFDKMNRRLGKQKAMDVFKKMIIKLLPLAFGTVENQFVKYSKKNKIQLVHAHFADIGWEFRKVAQQLKVPFVISFYGWDYEKLPYTKPEYKARFQELFKLADAFICEGSHGASILERYGCPKEKIFVVRLGLNAETIPVLSRDKTANQLRLVQIASFTEKKGQRYAIEAVALLAVACPNIRLTLIGNNRDPKQKTILEELVIKHQIQDKVEFLPAIDYQELYKTLGNYDVFIHPSCYAADRDCEGGAPVVLLDAQATGMPVLATTHCDIPDEVVHEQTGLLSPEKNIIALAENIKTFYQMNSEEYQTFVVKARRHMEQQYDLKKNARALETVYHQIIT